MPTDVQDALRGFALRALNDIGGSSKGGSSKKGSSNKGGGLSGVKGLAAGAGAAALVPLAIKNAGRIGDVLGLDSLEDLLKSPQQAVEGLGSKVGSSIGDKISDKVDEAGGPGGILKDALPFGGDDDDDDESGGSGGGAPGVGKGRRMPVQQSVDIGVAIETVYNQFTQFEEWPNFMHRVTRVTQEDQCTVSFASKIWGKTKEFTAKIETQRPDERIKWNVSQGITHRGVVTFHELGPHLTRVLVTMDLEPGGLLEKAARGMRHVKRAVRADLHRFKAFIEMTEHETGAWRGVIENGEVVEEHDPSYDEQREYADMEEVLGKDEDEDEGSEDEQESDDDQQDSDEQQESGDDEGSTPRRRQRSRSRASATNGDSGSAPKAQSRQRASRSHNGHSAGGSSSRSRSGGSRSSSNGQSGGRSSRSRSSQSK